MKNRVHQRIVKFFFPGIVLSSFSFFLHHAKRCKNGNVQLFKITLNLTFLLGWGLGFENLKDRLLLGENVVYFLLFQETCKCSMF